MCKMNESTQSMVSNVVRSVAIAAVGLPLALGVTNSLGAVTNFAERATEEVAGAEAVKSLKNDLTKDCIYFMMSEDDSQLEQAAKNSLDVTFGQEGVNYGTVCAWVLNG